MKKSLLKISFALTMTILAFSFFRLAEATDNSDQQFEGFNLKGYNETGEMAWDVKGDTADILGSEIKISNVDANMFGQQKMNVTAARGFIDQTSGKMRLEEDVVMTSEEGSRLTTDSLDWDKEEDLVTTEDRVFLKDRRMTARGKGMTARPGLKTAKILKKVTVRMNTEPDQPMTPSQMVTITSDGPMTIDSAQSFATFEDNVVAVQLDRTMMADRMEVYFADEMTAVKEMVCIGNVEIVQDKNKSFSEKLVYSVADQRLKLSGRPKLIFLIEGGDSPLATLGN